MEHNQMRVKNLILIILFLILFVIPVYADDYQDAVGAYESQDYKTAISKLKPLVDQGDTLAQSGLGMMYEKGYGVAKNYQKAIELYSLAAEKGLFRSS